MSERITSYDIRVQGHLDEHWSDWFDAVLMTHHGDGTTTVRCTVQDQPALHALLAKVRDLGATLVSVTPSSRRTRPTRIGAVHEHDTGST